MSYLPNTRSVIGIVSVVVGVVLVAGCQSESSQEEQAPSESPLPEGELAIEKPWVQPAPAGRSSALYMTIANGRNMADTLRRVRAPIIGGSEVYRVPSDTGDAEVPADAESLAIPARTRLALTPEDTHVRLTDLSQSFDENNSVILSLEFAKSGLQRVRVPVQEAPPGDE